MKERIKMRRNAKRREGREGKRSDEKRRVECLLLHSDPLITIS
jgi:hypothetical protein